MSKATGSPHLLKTFSNFGSSPPASQNPPLLIPPSIFGSFSSHQTLIRWFLKKKSNSNFLHIFLSSPFLPFLPPTPLKLITLSDWTRLKTEISFFSMKLEGRNVLPQSLKYFLFSGQTKAFWSCLRCLLGDIFFF